LLLSGWCIDISDIIGPDRYTSPGYTLDGAAHDDSDNSPRFISPSVPKARAPGRPRDRTGALVPDHPSRVWFDARGSHRCNDSPVDELLATSPRSSRG